MLSTNVINFSSSSNHKSGFVMPGLVPGIYVLSPVT